MPVVIEVPFIYHFSVNGVMSTLKKQRTQGIEAAFYSI